MRFSNFLWLLALVLAMNAAGGDIRLQTSCMDCKMTASAIFSTAGIPTTIRNEWVPCAASTSYDWTSSSMPTDSERLELCICTDLVVAIQKRTQSPCCVMKDGSNRGVATDPPATDPPTTDPPAATTSTPSPSPSPSTSPSPSPSSQGVYVNDGDTQSTNRSTIYVLVGGFAALLLVVVVVAFVDFRYVRQRGLTGTGKPSGGDHAASPSGDRGFVAMTSTPTTESLDITTTGSRKSQPHGRRGGFGEVYQGTYMRETVAIKQLLPARCKDLAQIDTFFAEVKMMLSFDHERIVHFIGVAWNSLSSVCVVVEYMANGDLRSVLSRWEFDENERRPRGFDSDKIKIAMHVTHALTYLHSLQPVIVHRDLKSKNIVLSEEFEAKLTDFGVSREQEDMTMTAGVGTSLWMAPEIMLGKRTHELPYADVMDADEPSRKLPNSAILHMIAMGQVTVQFTEEEEEMGGGGGGGGAHAELVALGRECVRIDPTQRPSSREVLHRVHQAWRQAAK